jgi:hypothetical protein
VDAGAVVGEDVVAEIALLVDEREDDPSVAASDMPCLLSQHF